MTTSIAAAKAAKVSSLVPDRNRLWGKLISLLHVWEVIVPYSSVKNEIVMLYGNVDPVM